MQYISFLKSENSVAMVLGTGGTSRDLLISFIMERARKGAKMTPGKDLAGSMFGAFHFSDRNS